MLLSDPAETLLGGTASILRALRKTPEGLSREQLCVVTGLHPKELRAALRRLHDTGLIRNVTVGQTNVLQLIAEHSAWPPIRQILSARRTVLEDIAGTVDRVAPDTLTVALLPSPRREPGTNPIVAMLVVRKDDRPEEANGEIVAALRQRLLDIAGADVDIQVISEVDLAERVNAEESEAMTVWFRSHTVVGHDLATWIHDLHRGRDPQQPTEAET